MNEELSAAIFAVSQDCRSGAGLLQSDVGVFPDQNSFATHIAEVNEICSRMDTLSSQALERHVSQAEFVALETELRNINAYSGGANHSAVLNGFARQGPPWS